MGHPEVRATDTERERTGEILRVAYANSNLILSNVKVANQEEDLENPVWRHLKRHYLAHTSRHHR